MANFNEYFKKEDKVHFRFPMKYMWNIVTSEAQVLEASEPLP